MTGVTEPERKKDYGVEIKEYATHRPCMSSQATVTYFQWLPVALGIEI